MPKRWRQGLICIIDTKWVMCYIYLCKVTYYPYFIYAGGVLMNYEKVMEKDNLIFGDMPPQAFLL